MDNFENVASALVSEVCGAELLQALASLIVTKASYEPRYAELYVQLCLRCCRPVEEGGCPTYSAMLNFKRILLEELQQSWQQLMPYYIPVSDQDYC